jgi:hypothetical protein
MNHSCRCQCRHGTLVRFQRNEVSSDVFRVANLTNNKSFYFIHKRKNTKVFRLRPMTHISLNPVSGQIPNLLRFIFFSSVLDRFLAVAIGLVSTYFVQDNIQLVCIRSVTTHQLQLTCIRSVTTHLF